MNRLLVIKLLVQVEAARGAQRCGQSGTEFLPEERGEVRVGLHLLGQRRDQRENALGEKECCICLRLLRAAKTRFDQATAQPLHHGDDFIVDGGGLSQTHNSAGRCANNLLGFVLQEGGEGAQTLAGGG